MLLEKLNPKVGDTNIILLLQRIPINHKLSFGKSICYHKNEEISTEKNMRFAVVPAQKHVHVAVFIGGSQNRAALFARCVGRVGGQQS